MSNGTRKPRLMHVLINKWSTSKYDKEVGARTLHVSYGNNHTKIEVVYETIVSSVALQLWSSQEDANTWMFLQAYHASSYRHTSVAISSSDTNIEVLACFHQTNNYLSMHIIDRWNMVQISPHQCAK